MELKLSQHKNKLEMYVASRFAEVFPQARPTKASGAYGEIGDINQPYFVVECKQRNTKNVSILMKTWNKLINSIPACTLRRPLLILENQDKKRFVVMEISDWFEMFKRRIK